MRAWRARCGGTSRLRGRVGQLAAVGDDAGLEGPQTSRPFKGGGIRPGLRYVKLGAVHSVQIADETFVAADPARVGAAVGDPSSWRRWWPDLRLRVIEDRGPLGIRWTVTGPLTGTMEIWLEPSLDGVLLHYFLHAEPSGVAAWQLARMNLARLTHRRRVAGKKMAFEVKTTLERSRPVGVSAVLDQA
jgi:hypothetical protein